MHLRDLREDIFNIHAAQKIYFMYRGDDFISFLDLKYTSDLIDKVVFNMEDLSEGIELTLEPSTEGSKWKLHIPQYMTQIFNVKQYDFTITVRLISGVEVTLFKGIANVNNRVFAKYFNGDIGFVLVKSNDPTQEDTQYAVGTKWINTEEKTIFELTQVKSGIAHWTETTNQTLRPIIEQLQTNKADKTYVDAHIEDLDNPHGVTAEQVDTYDKQVIDNKDANTLQEAKDYTYSKVEIVNKDTVIMNKVNNLEDANMFKGVSYNNSNGIFTFTRYDGTTKEIDLPLELIVTSGYYDEVANELVLVLANSSEIRIPVDNLLTDLDAHNIRFNGSGTNYLVNKNDVEGAVKELDKVIRNIDYISITNQDTQQTQKMKLYITNNQIGYDIEEE